MFRAPKRAYGIAPCAAKPGARPAVPKRDASNRNRLGTGALLAILALATQAQAASFGADDRRPLPASRLRLADSIGLVSTSDGQHACTAVCLSPSVIATAAHCLVPPEPDAPPRPLTFRVGPPAARRAARVAEPSPPTGPLVGSRLLRLKAPINATDDWGLARLAEPVCGAHGLPLSERSREQVVDAGLENRLVVAGFHRDVSLETLSYQQGCAVDASFPDRGGDDSAVARDFADATDLLLHRCDTGLGSSGAPLLLDGVAGPEVAGLNIGTYHIARFAQSHDGSPARRIGAEPIANTAVSARVLVAALDRFPGRETLSAGAELTALQQQLAARRIYTGAIDGRPSLALRVAIVSYERQHELPATGLATRALLARLSGEPMESAASSRPSTGPLATGSTR